eukprot:scaffold280241_cov30-Tisochrysis_lutea.AAC.1
MNERLDGVSRRDPTEQWHLSCPPGEKMLRGRVHADCQAYPSAPHLSQASLPGRKSVRSREHLARERIAPWRSSLAEREWARQRQRRLSRCVRMLVRARKARARRPAPARARCSVPRPPWSPWRWRARARRQRRASQPHPR